MSHHRGAPHDRTIGVMATTPTASRLGIVLCASVLLSSLPRARADVMGARGDNFLSVKASFWFSPD